MIIKCPTVYWRITMRKEALTPYSELDATLKYIFWYDQPMAKRNYLVEGVSGTGKVQYVTNFEGVVMKPLMAIENLLIRATLKRKTNRSLWS